jgi:G3E family GTPase
MEVAHKDGELGASENENEEDQEQETKNVVDGVNPDAGHDEKKLDEDGGERKNATHKDRRQEVEVKNLFADRTQRVEENTQEKKNQQESARGTRPVFPDSVFCLYPHLLRNLPRNLVRLDGRFYPLMPEAKVRSSNRKRRGDQQPQRKQRDDRTKRNRGGGVGSNEEEVENQEGSENEPVREKE